MKKISPDFFDLMEMIHEAERRFPVDKWTMDDVAVWPLVRTDIFFSARRLSATSGEGERRRNSGPIVSRMLETVFEYIGYGYRSCTDERRFLRPNGKADALFYTDNFSLIQIGDEWFNKYCDPLIDIFRDKGYRSLVLNPGRKTYAPYNNPSMFLVPYLDALRVRRFLAPRGSRREHLPQWDDFMQFLSEKGVPDTLYPLDTLRERSGEVLENATFYLKLLRRLRPSIVCIVCYYSLQGMALCRACREYGIPSVDIQHGLQGDFHIAYGSWGKIPKNGYELLPRYFLCWEEEEARAIRKWSGAYSEFHTPVVVGNLFLKFWKSGGFPKREHYFNRMMEYKALHEDKIHVLFTLNRDGIEEHHALLSILEVSRESGDCFFWIRLHPSQMGKHEEAENFLKHRGFEHVDVVRSSEYPLYSILEQVDVHVTSYSSVVLEASLFGVPSVIINEIGAALFSEAVSAGRAVTAFETTDILEAIRARKAGRGSMESERAGDGRSYEEGLQTLLGSFQ